MLLRPEGFHCHWMAQLGPQPASLKHVCEERVRKADLFIGILGHPLKDFLLGLRERGLHGAESVVADGRAGLRAALREVLPRAFVRRCHVHFLRNALDHRPRKADDDCLQGLRWIRDRRAPAQATTDPAVRPRKRTPRCPRLTERVEETFTCHRLPRQQHEQVESANMPERPSEDVKRRTYVVRTFPNAESCSRLLRALAVEMHENWPGADRDLDWTTSGAEKLQLRGAARSPPPAPGPPAAC